MKLLVFSVFDSKAEVYGTPIFFATKGLAIRAFSDQVNRPDSPLNAHSGDFTLFEIGEFSQDTGMLESHKTPYSLGTGLEYKNDGS